MPSHPEYHLDDERRGNQDRAGLIALLGLVRDRLSEGDENHAEPDRNQQARGNAGPEKYPSAAGYFALARQPCVENADDQQRPDALRPPHENPHAHAPPAPPAQCEDPPFPEWRAHPTPRVFLVGLPIWVVWRSSYGARASR